MNGTKKHDWHWKKNLFLLVVFAVMFVYGGAGVEGLVNAAFATGFVWLAITLIAWLIHPKR